MRPEEVDSVRREAIALAGRTSDLAQRSAVYHHMYEHSGGNYVFPLLAAHGALWGSGYFATGLRIGAVLSFQYGLSPKSRRAHLDQLEAFAEAFKEINRQVCVETYAAYHLTDRFPNAPNLNEYVPAQFLEPLLACHEARHMGVRFDHAERRALFESFFRWEQDHVVGPGVDAAVQAMAWPLIKRIALKPTIGFKYFKFPQRLYFANFASKTERIEKGLTALDLAEQAGWDRVNATLSGYNIMPPEFTSDSHRYFTSIRRRLGWV